MEIGADSRNVRVELNGGEPELTCNISSGAQYEVRFVLHTPPEWQADSRRQGHLAAARSSRPQGAVRAPATAGFAAGHRWPCRHEACCFSTPVSFINKDMNCIPSDAFGDLAPNRACAFDLDDRLTRGTFGAQPSTATLMGSGSMGTKRRGVRRPGPLREVRDLQSRMARETRPAQLNRRTPLRVSTCIGQSIRRPE